VGAVAYRSKKRARIGQHKLTYWNDPNGAPEDLLALAENDEYRALQNPNFPLTRLIEFALKAPQYIERNPSLQLYELESPQGYRELLLELHAGWMAWAEENLSLEDKQKLAIAAAWRHVENYEALTAEDETMRNLLRASLGYVEGLFAKEELARMRKAAHKIEWAWVQKGNQIAADKKNLPYAISALLRAAEAAADTEKVEEEETNQIYALGTLEDAVFYLAGGTVGQKWSGHIPSDVRDALLQEALWQSRQIRKFYLDEERSILRQSILATIKETQARQAATKAQAQKAIAQAQEGAKQIAAIMAKEDPNTWPVWLGLGMLATGAVVLLVGPELLVASSVAVAASEIVAAAEAAEVSAVSVQAFIDGTYLSEADSATLFLKELTQKLSAKGVQVVSEAAEVVAKVAR